MVSSRGFWTFRSRIALLVLFREISARFSLFRTVMYVLLFQTRLLVRRAELRTSLSPAELGTVSRTPSH